MSEDEKITPKSNRLRWIDQARGFIMVYLVLTITLPKEVFEDIAWIKFLVSHPSTTAPTMNLFDIGTPAFMFLIGLSFSISFWKRKEKKGTFNAFIRVFLRFALLLFLGLFIEAGLNKWDLSALIKEKNGMQVLYWDVIPSLGLVGLVTLPTVFIRKPAVRMAVAYYMMLVYQTLLMETYLRDYAISAIHGGIYGTLFGFSAVVIIASALGDYILFDEQDQNTKYRNMTIFGAVNLVLGIGIGFLPEFFWNKRQVTMAYCLVSIGAIVLGLMLFVLIDQYWNKKMRFLEAFGMSPFMSYFVAEIIYQLGDLLLEDAYDTNMKWIFTAVIFVVVTTMNLLLYWRKKKIRTEFVTIAFIVLVFALSFVV